MVAQQISLTKAYPNPGYQGPFSHAALFHEIQSAAGDALTDAIVTPRIVQDPTVRSIEKQASTLAQAIAQTGKCLQDLRNEWPLAKLKVLVEFWLAKGLNLALAEPLVRPCMDGVFGLEQLWLNDDLESHTRLLLHLVRSSEAKLDVAADCTMHSFMKMLCDPDSIRLEVLGIVLCAIGQATITIPFCPPVYTTAEARYKLQRLTTSLLNHVMELCLALDCLNDVQLILQWEHFVLQSNVAGDQSKWSPGSLL